MNGRGEEARCGRGEQSFDPLRGPAETRRDGRRFGGSPGFTRLSPFTKRLSNVEEREFEYTVPGFSVDILEVGFPLDSVAVDKKTAGAAQAIAPDLIK